VCTNLAVGGGGVFTGGFMAVHAGEVPITQVTNQLTNYPSPTGLTAMKAPSPTLCALLSAATVSVSCYIPVPQSLPSSQRADHMGRVESQSFSLDPRDLLSRLDYVSPVSLTREESRSDQAPWSS
jgi:hypothetical protein